MLASLRQKPSSMADVQAVDRFDLFAHRALPYIWASVLSSLIGPYLFFVGTSYFSTAFLATVIGVAMANTLVAAARSSHRARARRMARAA